jgi:drug/metabolite transporter (DMT)-like permease
MATLPDLDHELAALAAAACWAGTGILAAAPAGHLGAIAFNRARQVTVTLLLALCVVVTGGWRDLTPGMALPLVLSGLIGIFVGDTLLFTALNRIGPRRAGILFALNAPISAVLGWIFLGETLPPLAILGILLTCGGVMLAILFGRRPGQPSALEAVKGPLWVGVALGLGAACGQALGSVIAKPVMAAGVDPFAASMLRVGVACLSTVMLLPLDSVKPRGALTLKVLGQTALTGILAMGIGMTLLLHALSGGKVGIVSTLSATSPVLILPLLWMTTGNRPAPGAWAGALLVVAGMAVLFLGK